jgi:hypothetical protein
MSKYEVKSVVCDYGVFEDNELKLICNSHANALKIKEILETDSDMSKPYVWQDSKIEELEKALELACEALNKNIENLCEFCCCQGTNENYGSCECDEQFETERTMAYFKTKAKEMGDAKY